MESLHFALICVLCCAIVLYSLHRCEACIFPIDMRQYAIRRLNKMRFRDWDLIFVFDSVIIQLVQALPSSHIAVVVSGKIISISHQHGFEIRSDIHNYLCDEFKTNANIRMAVQRLQHGSIATTKRDAIVNDLCRRPIKYWHR